MEEEVRMNPEAILDRIASDEENVGKGKLKIFFGYAAGIGKTYAMLLAAHEEKKAGIDVVAGYIEPHARPETMKLVEGLEVLPPKVIPYQSIELTEFDIDSALKRKPNIILVDELAHTNAVGSRHLKRYEDIRELLNAGINVYTTVNVQHIESLHDLIAQITGVMVRERIPDSVFDEANQIEMIDIQPEELIARLEQGKIYKKDRVKKALGNFFTEDNLIALREIALRRMADWVNQEQSKSIHQLGKEGAVGEHILMCLSPSPSNDKVIRQAARMAKAFHGKFTAFYVETPESSDMDKEDIQRLRENTKLAAQFGANTVTSYGSDIVEQIAEYAKLSKVTKVVLGRSYSKRSLFLVKESFSERLSKLCPSIEIFLIPDSYDQMYRKKKKKTTKVQPSIVSLDIIKTLMLLSISSGIAIFFKYMGFQDSNIVMTYILGVLVTAIITKYKFTSYIYSFISVFTYDFFFTDPKLTFNVYEGGYIITIVIMLIMSLISSTVTQKVKNEAKVSAKKAYRTEVLLETSQKLQHGKNTEDIVWRTIRQLGKLLDKTIYCYVGDPEKNPKPIIYHSSSNISTSIPKTELAVATWTYKNNKHAGASTTTLPGAKCLYMAVRNGDRVFAVIGIELNGEVIQAFEQGILVAILNECAFALEKEELLLKEREVAIQLKQEQLRANLLRSISHDLRTPLTSISGNASMLIENSDLISSDKKHELYEYIYDDSMWLINLVENLLSVTRIENGTMQLDLEPELVEDLIVEAMKHIDRKSKQHRVSVDVEEVLVARVDAKRIIQVIINLVDNAIKYTPAGSHIEVVSCKEGEYIAIEVRDDGPGIDDEQKTKIFTMFHTVNDSVSDGRRGMGLGLALCKSIVDAHGGKLEVLDNKPKGAIFRLTLKLEEVKELQ
ncbi:MAG TPA: histidine kinase [Lachnospiraceae bacterium]|uniref:sensor histidine kinase KdpD n=1 Tax=Anaerosporobacter sp. TaxID=1872529 RepID=UPI000EEE08F6|nr:sensor histidine kinase KdpD [Anaerosporobacter sp.]HAB59596.1 histidine kinase [Lachnospiraceae bacterium]